MASIIIFQKILLQQTPIQMPLEIENITYHEAMFRLKGIHFNNCNKNQEWLVRITIMQAANRNVSIGCIKS